MGRSVRLDLSIAFVPLMSITVCILVQVRQLEGEAVSERSRHALETEELCRALRRVESDNEGLKSELLQVTEMLSQRTVLYAAQERRVLADKMHHSSASSSMSESLRSMQLRMEGLRSKLMSVETLNMSLLSSNKELLESSERLRLQVLEQEERAAVAEEAASRLGAESAFLAQSLDGLRGSDLQEVERSLSQQVAAMRAAAKATEVQLRSEAGEAREGLARELEARAALEEQIASLAREISVLRSQGQRDRKSVV